MNTRELLEKYQSLVKSGTFEEAHALVEANRENKRFISLIDLRTAFLEGFKKELEERVAFSKAEIEEKFEHEMHDHAMEVLNFAVNSAKERAKRLSAVFA